MRLDSGATWKFLGVVWSARHQLAIPAVQENLVARMEGALEAALAALEDEKRSAASKAEAVASAFRMTKGVAVDLFKENQRLQSEVRKARTAEAQASKAVEQGVDELLRLQAEIRSAQHAEKKDIVESLERHRRDNARLQVWLGRKRFCRFVLHCFPWCCSRSHCCFRWCCSGWHCCFPWFCSGFSVANNLLFSVLFLFRVWSGEKTCSCRF